MQVIIEKCSKFVLLGAVGKIGSQLPWPGGPASWRVDPARQQAMRRDSGWGLVDAVPAGPSGQDQTERIPALTAPPHRLREDQGFNNFPPMVDLYGYAPRQNRAHLQAVEANVGLIRQLPSPSISYMDDSTAGLSRHASELFALPPQDEDDGRLNTDRADREVSIPPQQRTMQMQMQMQIRVEPPPATKADLPSIRERPTLMHSPPQKDVPRPGPDSSRMQMNPADRALALKRMRACAISDAVMNRPFGTSWTTDDLELVFPVIMTTHDSARKAVAKEMAQLPPSIADKFPDPRIASRKGSGKFQFLFASLQAIKQEDARPEKRAQVLKACEIHLLKGMKLRQSEWMELRRVATEIQALESNVELKKAALSLEVTVNRFAGIMCTQRWSTHDKVRSDDEVEFNNRRVRPRRDDADTRNQQRSAWTAGPVDLAQNPLAAIASTPTFLVDMIAKLPGELWQDRPAPAHRPSRPLPQPPGAPHPASGPPLSARQIEEMRVMHHAMQDRYDQFVVM